MRPYNSSTLRDICPVKWHPNIPENGISFGVADVDFQGPDGITDYLKENIVEDFAFYKHQIGLPATVRHILDFVSLKGITADNHNVQVIPGTMIGIYAAMKWVTRRNRNMLSLGPIYPPIHQHSTDQGNQVDWIEVSQNGFDEEMLKNKFSKDLDLVAICNPCNPTGYMFSKSDFNVIGDLCEEYDVMCFSDELYEPLIFEGNHTSAGSSDKLKDRSILLYGFSKAYGLAGYRSGFMITSDKDSEEIQKIIEAQLVSPSPMASIVCSFALRDERAANWKEEFRTLMKKNTSHAAKIFRENGYSCVTPKSTFFVFPDLGTDDRIFVPQLLKNQGVQVVEGTKFGPMGKNHVRINCATSNERMLDGINRIITELQMDKSN